MDDGCRLSIKTTLPVLVYKKRIAGLPSSIYDDASAKVYNAMGAAGGESGRAAIKVLKP
jgi:hypothetical protein